MSPVLQPLETRFKVEFWKSPTGNMPVADWVERQEEAAVKKIMKRLEYLETYGPSQLVRASLLEKFKGSALYEICIDFGKIWYRILLVVVGSVAWLLHAFIKKSNGTPPKEIDIAMGRYELLIASLRKEQKLWS